MTSKTGNRRDEGHAAPVQVAQTAPEATASSTPANPPSPARKTKASLLRDMLSAPGGVSLQSLMAATGWQAHTVRAALSGLRKSGVALTRTPGDAGPIYAIVIAAGMAPEKAGEAKPARPRSRQKGTKTATEHVGNVIAAVDGSGQSDIVAELAPDAPALL